MDRRHLGHSYVELLISSLSAVIILAALLQLLALARKIAIEIEQGVTDLLLTRTIWRFIAHDAYNANYIGIRARDPYYPLISQEPYVRQPYRIITSNECYNWSLPDVLCQEVKPHSKILLLYLVPYSSNTLTKIEPDKNLIYSGEETFIQNGSLFIISNNYKAQLLRAQQVVNQEIHYYPANIAINAPLQLLGVADIAYYQVDDEIRRRNLSTRIMFAPMAQVIAKQIKGLDFQALEHKFAVEIVTYYGSSKKMLFAPPNWLGADFAINFYSKH